MTKFDKSYHSGYQVMPAAVDFLETYTTLGVRFQKNPRSRHLTKEIKDGVHMFHYPDRTVYRMRPGSSYSCIPEDLLDSYLDVSILSNPELYKNLGYRYAMISPPHMQFRKAAIRNPHLRLFADSGGFQMRQGVTDFINPDTLIDFYNASTDVGIGLDVPMHPSLYPKYLARMSHVTSRNNKYIKDHLSSEVTLYDLNHGADLQDRKIFFDITEQYEPNDGIAMGGTASNARGDLGVAEHLIKGVLSVSYVLSRAKTRYKTAHILGTTTPFYMFVFHLMTKSGFFPHITSDSSTYAQAAIMNTQLTSVPGKSILYRNPLPKGNVLYRTPCACPVCSMIGYAHNLVVNAQANVIHSLYHYAFTNELISDLADQWLAGTIKKSEVEKIICPPAFNHRYFSGLMKFLENLFDSGFTKAYKNNADFLQPIEGKTKSASLFGTTQRKIQVPNEDAQRTDRILTSYEKWLDERLGKRKSK